MHCLRIADNQIRRSLQTVQGRGQFCVGHDKRELLSVQTVTDRLNLR